MSNEIAENAEQVVKYYYDAKTLGFYIDNPPDSAIEISQETYVQLFKGQSAGKVIIPDDEGNPVLADPPEPTQEQLIYDAQLQLNSYMSVASLAIAPLQDAVDLDMATDKEKTDLTAWKKYRVQLNRIDTSTAPDISWPDKPV